MIAHKHAKERLEQLKDPHTRACPTSRSATRRPSSSAAPRWSCTISASTTPTRTLVMRLPKEKIVFIVDTIPVGAFPGRGFIDIYPLETEDFIKKVIAMDWERMIPGHPGQPGGRLGTKQDAKDVLTLMQEASAEIKKLAQAGKCWDAAEKEFKLEKYASWPGYANGLPFWRGAIARCGAAAPDRCGTI